MTRDLRTIGFDPGLREGAYNAIRVCLRLQREERMTIIADEESSEIAAALVAEVEKTGAPYQTFVLEDLAARPMARMPGDVLADLEQSQVSLLAAVTKKGELPARMEMMKVVNRNRIRHAHMVNITRQIMVEGMRADYQAVDRISLRVLEKARQTRAIRATTPGGTDIHAEFSPALRWIKTSGIISAEKWGNLPGGEVFTSPARVDGVFVVDGVVGDHLCAKYGDLRATPLTIEIEDSRIAGLACDNPELLRDFADYTRTDENSNRVGEFAIGTNLAVRDVIGNMLQDEKIPGLHIAFGHPYNEHTGQTWNSTTHIDCVGRDFDIWMDGEQVMRAGQFVLEALEEAQGRNGHG